MTTPRPTDGERVCWACDGKGHFSGYGKPSADPNDRACMECDGTGKPSDDEAAVDVAQIAMRPEDRAALVTGVSAPAFARAMNTATPAAIAAATAKLTPAERRWAERFEAAKGDQRDPHLRTGFCARVGGYVDLDAGPEGTACPECGWRANAPVLSDGERITLLERQCEEHRQARAIAEDAMRAAVGERDEARADAIDECIAIVNDARFNGPKDLRELIAEMKEKRGAPAPARIPVTPELRAKVEAVRKLKGDGNRLTWAVRERPGTLAAAVDLADHILSMLAPRQGE